MGRKMPHDDAKIVSCRGCNAKIFFIKTPKGKNHPLDVKPKRMWVQRTTSKEGFPQIEWRLELCYESHFSNCPAAESFRGSQDKNVDGNR